MTDYVEHTHKNPDGSSVKIWHHPLFDPAEIGDRAEIGYRAKIGDWARIGDGAEIGYGARIGDGAEIGDGTEIGYGARIGDWARIGDGARIGDEARIGDWARIGDGARIGDEAEIGYRARIGDDDPTPYPIYCAPLPMGPANYYVTITSKTMTIGCEHHPLEDWFAFGDTRIIQMDGKTALKYWRAYRDVFRAMAVANGWLK